MTVEKLKSIFYVDDQDINWRTEIVYKIFVLTVNQLTFKFGHLFKSFYLNYTNILKSAFIFNTVFSKLVKTIIS